jgi:sugar phosphate isomerase/epimerase
MNFSLKKSRRTFLRQSVLGALGAMLASVHASASASKGDEKRFELSLHHGSLKPLIDNDALSLMGYAKFAGEQLGIHNIEFGADFCAELLGDAKKTRKLRKVSKRNGVRNRVLLDAAEPALDAPTMEEREAAIASYVKWAKVAEGLGCEFIRVRASSPGDRNTQLANAAHGIGTLCDKLKSSPVSVLIENVAEFSRDPSWLIALVKRIGTDRVGVLADFGNFDGDLYDGMKQLLPYTKSVCTKSWAFDAAGEETKIDYKRMMNIIKASKFHGCIAIEYLGDNPVDGVRKTAALIKKHS